MVAVPMPATARAGGREADRWGDQLYADGLGRYRYEPVWVPARYVCY